MLIKQYQTERTFSPHYRNHFNDFLSTFKFQYYYSYGDSLPKNDIEVYYLRKSNGLQNYSLVYSSYPTSKKPMGGLAGNVRPCQNYNQSAEKGIVWLGTILCICHVVVVGIVYHVTLDISNPLMGKLCFKCQYNTVANTNKTKCLPFTYKHFKITYIQRIVAAALSILGCIYHTFIFAVILYYKNTPIVKSSNFMLSVLQISLHVIFNVHLAIVILEQQQYICYIHSIFGGYLFKIIMSTYIIKTNQLLAIFQSSTKIIKKCLFDI